MLGRIKNIEEIYDFETESYWCKMDGYKIETEDHIFYVLIDNSQSCCEDWGYFSSEDDYRKFINSDLKEINLTDTSLNKKMLDEKDIYLDEGGIQFVDFVTSEGIFQLAVYNGHNGYYGHDILILKDNETILESCL